MSPVNAVSEGTTKDVKEKRIREAPMTPSLDVNRLSIDFDLWFQFGRASRVCYLQAMLSVLN